jgi:hypothetical protein
MTRITASKSRTTRFNPLTPLYIFVVHPREDEQFVLQSEHVGNVVTN